MATRIKRPQTIIGIGTLILGVSIFLIEVFSGGISMIYPFSFWQWLSLAGIGIGIVLILYGLLKEPDKETVSAKPNPLEDIKSDLVTMNTIQREVATKKGALPYSKKIAKQVGNDFMALFGSDVLTFATSLIQKIVTNRNVDPMVDLYKKFGDIVDSNECGLKAELEDNRLYKIARTDLAKKRLKLRVSKKKNRIIQSNIDRTYTLIYGLNSYIVLRGIFRLAKGMKIVPTELIVTMEGVEFATEKTLNTMLNDLENEWKVTVNLNAL